MPTSVSQKKDGISKVPNLEEDDRRLAEAIGSQIREYRNQLKMTVVEVSKQSDLSQGMLSKIERGVTSPSLRTLSALDRALNVPVTAFFRKYEEQRDCSYVKKGEGLVIENMGEAAKAAIERGLPAGNRGRVDQFEIDRGRAQ